jgi:hypothetical protein
MISSQETSKLAIRKENIFSPSKVAKFGTNAEIFFVVNVEEGFRHNLSLCWSTSLAVRSGRGSLEGEFWQFAVDQCLIFAVLISR